jgi:hypothetical protein
MCIMDALVVQTVIAEFELDKCRRMFTGETVEFSRSRSDATLPRLPWAVYLARRARHLYRWFVFHRVNAGERRRRPVIWR